MPVIRPALIAGSAMVSITDIIFSVSAGRFADSRKITCNAGSGEITLNPDNKERGALFDQPLYISKSDPGKAEQWQGKLYSRSVFNRKRRAILNPFYPSVSWRRFFL